MASEPPVGPDYSPRQQQQQQQQQDGHSQSKRRYNQSCDACRASKRKCPGRDPATGESLCTTCAARGLPCVYGSLGEPSRLRQADAENERMRDVLNRLMSADNPEERDYILSQWSSDSSGQQARAPRRRKRKKGPDEEASGSYSDDTVSSNHPIASTSRVGGSSSYLQAGGGPGGITGLSNGADQTHHLGQSDVMQAASTIISYTQDSEDVYGALAADLRWAFPKGLDHGLPSDDEQDTLLDFYFSWLNPRYQLLDQDLYLASKRNKDGRYCSSFLIWALCAHTAAHCPGYENRRKEYRARAHLLLGIELSKSTVTNLPTAQGVLLLSGSAAAQGTYDQSWALLHICIGITTALSQDRSTSDPAELDLRNRLHWATYIYAMIQTLNLNRRPPLLAPDVELPQPDPVQEETIMWKPVLPVKTALGVVTQLDYPIKPGYELTCHRHLCILFQFYEEVMLKVYAAGRHALATNRRAVVHDIRNRMVAWQSQLPAAIFMDVEALPDQAPAPHIVHFNLLLRTAWIFLYRPFYDNVSSRHEVAGAQNACDQCAREVHSLLVLFERTFGGLRITYIYIYSVYWAATIVISAVKREGLTPDLRRQLQFYEEILISWQYLPGMRNSVGQLLEEVSAYVKIPDLDSEASKQSAPPPEVDLFADPFLGIPQYEVQPSDPIYTFDLGNPGDEVYWQVPTWSDL